MDEYNLVIKIRLEKEGEITLTKMEDDRKGGEHIPSVRIKRLYIPLADAGRSHSSKRLYATIKKLIAEGEKNERRT